MRKNRRRLKFTLFAIAMVLIAIILLLDSALRPIIKSYSITRATMHVTTIINNSVSDEITENQVNYDDLIHLTYDDIGAVSSVQTDMMELNMLQSSITNRIIEDLTDYDLQIINIPLGNMFGSPILSGRGPVIEIRLIPANFIRTKIVNDFDSAGINQTRHRVMLEIELIVSAILPGYSSSTTVSTNVVLAETIVVGTVPEAFTQVSDGSDPLVGLIQDYGATVPE